MANLIMVEATVMGITGTMTDRLFSLTCELSALRQDTPYEHCGS